MPSFIAWYKSYSPADKSQTTPRHATRARKLGDHSFLKLDDHFTDPSDKENSFYPLKRDGTLINSLTSTMMGNRATPLNHTVVSLTMLKDPADHLSDSANTPRTSRKNTSVLDRPRMRLEKIKSEWKPASNDLKPIPSHDTNSVFGYRVQPQVRPEAASGNTSAMTTPRRLPPLRRGATSTSLSPRRNGKDCHVIEIDMSQFGTLANTPVPEHELARQKKDCLCGRCREKKRL